LWDHSCAYFLRPILAAHDPSRLELICYTTSTSDDWMTGELRARADGWRSVAGKGEDALINSLRADGLDILIELSGHTGNGPLAALRRRAAPVQAMYLGYPNTTGLPTIDWRLVDAVTDPPGAEHFSTERLARIDGCFLCYSGLVDIPPTPPPPPPPASPVTFGSFNSIRKIGPAVVRTWSAILLATPGSRLLIKTRGISTPAAARSFRSAFAECGIDAARLELMDGLPDKREHLNLYGRLHLALDTFPYNGTTTTCEALWMGVPVVTLSGAMHAGRVGASLLRAAGMPELVADSPDRFVALASGLAQNPDRLAATRAKALAFRGSSLCDAAAFVPKFEAALRTTWREWCSRATPR
jgi:predicted O-linked N-acetylglucosamine transferase (SPINDLY family)